MLTNPNKNYLEDNIEKQTAKIIEFPEKNNSDEVKFKESTVIIKSNNKIENRYSSSGDANYKPNSNKNSNIVKFENNKNKGNGSNLPPKPTILSIIGLSILIFTTWAFTNKNSQEVFISGKSVGIIKDKKITSEELKNIAIAKLKEDLGTDIEVNEEITLKNVHSSKSDIVSTEHILSEITKRYTFQVEASSILVNGKEIAVVKNKDEADEVLKAIASKYLPEGQKAVIKPEFVENVEVKSKFVDEDDIIKKETAISLLNVNSDQGKKYKIKAGDTLYGIAIESGMKMEELLKINPTINENTKLKIGQEINLVIPVPLLSVVTNEKVTFTETIPKKIETIKNDKEYKTYKKVISPGKEGTKEVTANIKKVNGIEQSREVVSEKVLVDSTVEKVEVGTLNTPPKKAIGNFIYPIRGARVSSGYGRRDGENHLAIDFSSPYGTPIKASDGGTVVFSGWGNGYGNMVKINHGNGFYTVYGHNSKNAVSVGQKVAQGEVIAYVGSTGNSTGNHVHFEIIKNGAKLNPLNYLK